MNLIHSGLKKCADMLRTVLIICLTLLGLPLKAQNAELTKLADIVKSLPGGGEKSYNNAVKLLAADEHWTVMDELPSDRRVECRASDRVPGFRLNSIMTNAERAGLYQTSAGGFLNGADVRFNYSLIERTLKAGASITFTLPERWGDQIIMLIPYGGEKAKISAKATGNAEFKATSAGQGAILLSGRVDKGKPLKLTVINAGQQNASYVILNYNSRK